MERVSNPPNPWTDGHVEWIGRPPEVELEVFEERARSILSENDSPDIPFRYSVNPYRGCQHGCAYCYARPTHQYIDFGAGTDFERRLVVKVNAGEQLRREIVDPE
ncbi:MAG: radical SAM protein, partial [Bradymonadaceae bacterium]